MKHGERKGQLTQAEKAQQMMYRLEFGEYLKELRNLRNLSTRAVGEELNISSNYISEIERGLKAPADQTIREFAELYKVDENILFDKLKRVPLKATELLETQDKLQNLLSEIQDSDLKVEEQEQLFQIMQDTFERYCENVKNGTQQNFNGRFYNKLNKKAQKSK
ncbi:transcriptional regulator [Priestia megaterium]|uniref:helix-turn-helix domain-containing protein n=1 Tax=Priestia megaterium TaxID=1404 RepID=UPI00203AC532|nr:transcriptional regulator [Priestia megaterium]MCM3155621.1 transcriptional regulator [Priestia megaterium]